MDVFPTFLDLASARPPANQPLDGESLAPLFRDAGASLKREAIFQHFPGYLGASGNTWRTLPVGLVHAGDWKLMEFMEDKRVELYNLREDIGEKNNLASSNPEKATALLEKLHNWQAAIQAPMPTANTEVKSAASSKGKKGKQKKNKKA